MINNITLHGVIESFEPLRYTPAGIAVLDIILKHRSEVQECGTKRVVEMPVKAKAFGQDAQQIARLTEQTGIIVQGFIAPLRKKSTSMVVHIQQWKTDQHF